MFSGFPFFGSVVSIYFWLIGLAHFGSVSHIISGSCWIVVGFSALCAGLVRVRFYPSLVGDICLLGSDYFRVCFWLFVIVDVSGFRIWFLRSVMFGGRTSCGAV